VTRTAASLPFRDHRPPLAALLEKATATVSAIGTEFDHYGCKLADLGSRFAEGRFHLAVLGQFKRGKSTLFNALTDAVPHRPMEFIVRRLVGGWRYEPDQKRNRGNV
jgi:hypothetical protein